jgi:hypothetical protein
LLLPEAIIMLKYCAVKRFWVSPDIWR